MKIQNHHKNALVFGERAVRYSEMIRMSHSCGKLMPAVSGDRILIICENRVEWVFAFLGAWSVNVIPVPVDMASAPEEIAYVINDCTPSAAFVSNQTAPLFASALAAASPDAANAISVLNVDELDFPDDLKTSENTAPIGFTHKDDVAAIIYTSGTTGDPKGVMLTFKNFFANLDAVAGDSLHMHKNSVMLILLPLHHVFPLVGTLIGPLCVGATCAISPSLNPSDIMDTLQKNKVTLIVGVPRLFSLLRTGILGKIKQKFIANLLFHILSIVRMPALAKRAFKPIHDSFGGHIVELISGGAALDKIDADFFTVLGFKIVEGYGMTEAAPMIACPELCQYRPGTVGRPIVNCEVKIDNGEVCFRGPNMMKGYYNRPEETAEIIRDGWLHTGDLGHFDKDGYLIITGRSKEIIVLPNGKNVNPIEVEQKIEALSPMVLEAATVEEAGMLSLIIRPDVKELKSGGIVHLEEFFRTSLIDKYNRKVSPWKRINRLYLVSEELPRTRLGKLRRHQLKDCINSQARRLSKDEAPTLREYQLIRDYLKQETGKSVRADDHLEIDLGLDSLAKISLLAFIKSKFGVQLEDTLLSQHSNVGQLARYVQKKQHNKQNGEEAGASQMSWQTIIHSAKDATGLPRSRFPHLLFMDMVKIAMNLICRVRVEGRQLLPDGPFILVANHQSVLDWPMVATALSRSMLKRTYIFAKQKHFKGGLRKWFARRSNIIVMNIHRDLNDAVQQMSTVLKTGNVLAIFPEGTRNTTGTPGYFKKTFAILSKELQIPVVPVAISGTNSVLPVASRRIRPFKKVTISFQTPVFPDNDSYDALAKRVRKQIAGALK